MGIHAAFSSSLLCATLSLEVCNWQDLFSGGKAEISWQMFASVHNIFQEEQNFSQLETAPHLISNFLALFFFISSMN